MILNDFSKEYWADFAPFVDIFGTVKVKPHSFCLLAADRKFPCDHSDVMFMFGKELYWGALIIKLVEVGPNDPE